MSSRCQLTLLTLIAFGVAWSRDWTITTLLAGMWITCEVIVVALVLCVRFLILRQQQDGQERNQGTKWFAKFNRPQQTIELTTEDVARLQSVNHNV
jgi:hypothetical protein